MHPIPCTGGHLLLHEKLLPVTQRFLMVNSQAWQNRDMSVGLEEKLAGEILAAMVAMGPFSS